MPRKSQRMSDKASKQAAVLDSVVNVSEGLSGEDGVIDSDSEMVSREQDTTHSKKYTLVQDDSDGSIVSVSRRVAPVVRNESPVRRFGSMDSDNEIQLSVREDRPPRTPVKQRLLNDDTFPSVSDKKRRNDSDENASPSKIRVQDLTLSPRKRASPGDAEDRRRTSLRKKPSQRVVSAEQAAPKLIQQLDALVSEDEDSVTGTNLSDTSYRPSVRPSSRGARTGQRGRKRGGVGSRERTSAMGVVSMANNVSEVTGCASDSLKSKPKVQAVGTGEDSHMQMESTLLSPSTKVGKRRLEAATVEFRALSDSEESLPSLDTVFNSFSGKGKARSGQDSSAGTSFAARVSPEWTGLDMDTNSEADGPRSSAESPNLQDKTVSLVEAGVAHKQVGLSVARPADPKRSSPKKVVSSPIADRSSVGVFSSAVPIPDDEDEEGIDDEDVVSQQALATGESPLLDASLVHSDLAELYASLRWINRLRRCRFIGYSNMEDVFDNFTPASYGGLLESVNPRVRSKLVRSMLFIEYRIFKNLARVPMTGFTRSWECVRAARSDGGKNVACVTTGVCLKSFVAEGREVGESWVKQLHVRPIENDWVILQCNIGTFFNDLSLHAPGRNNALVFQTKRQGWSPRRSDQDKANDKLASAPYNSPKKGSGSISTVVIPDSSDSDSDVAGINILESGPPPYRLFQEGIPLYDGRTRPGAKGFRFEPADWDKYNDFPLYPFPEVEDQSLVTVVYTLTGFRIGKAPHHTVHFNALFAIVLGRVDA
ncbi:hypothetical protein VNI00_017659 [Paramarasmius palmivorus]|uniref:Uncharacterized protein n=1 Tax=Paramarasmius palmivorus TaxID=297713 RepID=A0AAW0B3U4_9AGAR